MNRSNRLLLLTLASLVLGLLACFPPASAGQDQAPQVEAAKPQISITRIPPPGAGADTHGVIAGRASGVDSRHTRVVVYAFGDTWYAQPWADHPYTSIHGERWSTGTHLGFRYAALLVRRSFVPPPTTAVLPPVGGGVLAIATAYPGRKISFSGYDWTVKSSPVPVGPGPNYFGASPANVRVDPQGRLHLAITRRNGRYYCAEVVSRRSFGYGTYRWYLDSPVDSLGSNVVLGLFTWSDDPSENHRELDLEFGRWDSARPENAQYVVQPYTDPQNLFRWVLPAGIRQSTHSFRWEGDQVTFQSARGLTPAPASSEVLQERTLTGSIPQAGGENARMNLWLQDGRPPGNGPVEVVIRRFEFVPLP